MISKSKLHKAKRVERYRRFKEHTAINEYAQALNSRDKLKSEAESRETAIIEMASQRMNQLKIHHHINPHISNMTTDYFLNEYSYIAAIEKTINEQNQKLQLSKERLLKVLSERKVAKNFYEKTYSDFLKILSKSESEI